MLYEKFDIGEVAEKCGITFKSGRRDTAELKALCPFCGDRKYHLCINRVKERFHCYRCKEGGNSVTLYAKLHNLSNKDAYEALAGNIDLKMPEGIYTREEAQTPMRPLIDRHNVYYDFLSMLRLSENHMQNLTRRGLEYHHIRQFMYRSMPLDDFYRRRVLDRLSAKHDLYGIPGFYTGYNGDWQMYIQRCGGYYIPVCNAQGYIQGLQIRLDVEDDDKFRWFSSNHYDNGTRALPWVHVVGDTTSDVAVITEGPLKADVASIFSGGMLFIAVAGVNAIELLTDTLKSLSPKAVIEAFDMDKRSNIYVKRALVTLRDELDRQGVKYSSFSWDSDYNGIDEYCHYWSKTKNEPLRIIG